MKRVARCFVLDTSSPIRANVREKFFERTSSIILHREKDSRTHAQREGGS
jgi:hypothetical protein